MELFSVELVPDLLEDFEKCFGCVGGQMCERSIIILTAFG